MMSFWSLVALVLAATAAHAQQSAQQSQPASQPAATRYTGPQLQEHCGFTVQEGDYIAHDFHFKSGQTLPELGLGHRRLGAPVRDLKGQVKNP
jgi:hypothetical protein